MSDALSIVDLARRTGEPVDLLREWRELGLISAPGQERFGPEAVERTRLVRVFVHRGVRRRARPGGRERGPPLPLLRPPPIAGAGSVRSGALRGDERRR